MPLNDPVPSNAPDVLLRNAQDFDKLINGSGNHTNRVGNSLPSYIQAIAELGFDAPVLFASGIVVDSSRKTVEYSGARYFAKPSAVPFTTTITFNPSQWQMFDQQFAGAEIAQIGTYSLLRAYAGAATLVYVAGRTNDQDGAAGNFAVDESDTTSADNDGTILVDALGRRWKRQTTVVTPEMFGAIGDGVANDAPAIQAFYNWLGANGGEGEFAAKPYLLNTNITLTNPTKGFKVTGKGDQTVLKFRGSSALTVLAMTKLHDVYMSDFLIDCGYSVTGFASHGYSFSDPNNVTMERVNVIDHRNSAGLMFLLAGTATATSQNVNGVYRNCYIIDSYSDSKGNGQNGFLLECLYASYIINCNVKALDPAGSPCIGLQLKNECRYSHIIGGSAEGCKAAVALGGDGGVAGSAGYYCDIIGVISKDCIDGGIFGKSTNCRVDMLVDMANNAANNSGINVAGFNVGLKVTASISNVPAGKSGYIVTSSDTVAEINYPTGIGTGKLLNIATAGVQRTFTRINYVQDLTATSDLFSYITDISGTTSNRVTWAFDSNTDGLLDSSSQHFRAKTSSGVLGYGGSTQAFNWTIAGTQHLSLNSSWLTPITDNTKALGRATQRWSTVYAGTGTINTSDDREKTYLAFSDVEKAVALELKANMRKFKFNDAVALKGAAARMHFGASAQTVKAIFEKHGLNPFDYGLICYDEWGEEIDGEGRITLEAGNRYGLRYEELLSFIIASM